MGPIHFESTRYFPTGAVDAQMQPISLNIMYLGALLSRSITHLFTADALAALTRVRVMAGSLVATHPASLAFLAWRAEKFAS